MKLEQIDETEYQVFVDRHPLGNFLQAAALGKRREEEGWQYELLGVRNSKGDLLATALLFSWTVTGGYKEYECLEGPLLDYDNHTLFQNFLSLIKEYTRDRRGIRLLIQPPILMHRRDEDAQIVEENVSHTAMQALSQMGFRQMDTAGKTDLQLRYGQWFFAKDMTHYQTYEQLLDELGPKVRNQIKVAQKYGVAVQDVTQEENLDEFIQVLLETGERRSFNARTSAYYRSVFRHFTREQAKFSMAYLDIDVYTRSLTEHIAALAKEKEAVEKLVAKDKKVAGRLKEIDSQLAAYKKREAETPQLRAAAGRDGKLILSAAIFMHVGQELVYFLSGSRTGFGQFNGPYALQAYALKYAIERRIPRYNFYLTNGNFNGHAEQESVYQFKKKFGGVVEEQIGSYVYVPRPFVFGCMELVRNIRKLVR